jgi:hypothetical protein
VLSDAGTAKPAKGLMMNSLRCMVAPRDAALYLSKLDSWNTSGPENEKSLVSPMSGLGQNAKSSN